MHEANAKATGVAEESVSCIRTVRAFANEEKEEERYGREVDIHYKLASRMGILVGLFQGLTFLGLNFSSFLVMLYGGHLVSKGELTSGALTSFLL